MPDSRGWLIIFSYNEAFERNGIKSSLNNEISIDSSSNNLWLSDVIRGLENRGRGELLTANPFCKFRITRTENWLQGAGYLDSSQLLTLDEAKLLLHEQQETQETQEHPMPTPPPTPTENSVITEAPTPTPTQLIKLAIKRNKSDSRLMLTIDAKPLHDILDSIGCTADSSGSYRDRPSADFRIVNNNRLSTELFLKRVYPYEVNLTGIFSTPPTVARLREICETALDAVRKILDHYQPIDISYTIHKRIVG
jgi:hypothetical protein